MHELALIQSVVEMVIEHAQGRCVRRVKLEIGKFTCITPDAMRFCFDVVATGTPLDGARLEIVEMKRCTLPCVWRDIRAADALVVLPLRGSAITIGYLEMSCRSRSTSWTQTQPCDCAMNQPLSGGVRRCARHAAAQMARRRRSSILSRKTRDPASLNHATRITMLISMTTAIS